MLWYIVLIGTLAFSCLIYNLRFSRRHVAGFPILQFIYMFFATPIITLSMINIALSVANRPVSQTPFISEDFLLNGYLLAVLLGAIGMGIHSLSVIIENVLLTGESAAYVFTNRIHGIISHEMVYLSSMFLLVTISWLELSHAQRTLVDPITSVSAGALLGALFGLTILRSTYLKINSIFSLLCLLSCLPLLLLINMEFSRYPATLLSISALSTLLAVFIISWIIYRYSPRMCRLMVGVLYPKGHAFRRKICG